MNKYTLSVAAPAASTIIAELTNKSGFSFRFEYKAETEKICTLTQNNFSFPVGNAEFFLTGSLESSGKVVSFAETLFGIDIAAVTGVIHDEEKDMSERIKQLHKNFAKIEAESHGDFYNPIVYSESAWSEGDITKVEQKYDFSMPLPLREVLLTQAIQIEDSYFVHSVDQMKTVAETFALFGYPAGVYTGMVTGPSGLVNCEAVFARSPVFFTEVSDGMGMLAYDPEDQVWFWMHEGYDLPRYLMSGAGVPWSTLDALASVFHKLAFGEVAECLPVPAAALRKTIFYFDSANPHGKLLLHFSGDEAYSKITLLDNDYLYFY